MKIQVLLAADGAAWESPLVQAFEHSGHGVGIARRCVDLIDLLASAAAGHGQVALVDAGLRRLDPDAVDRLHSAGVTPVAVVVRADTATEDRMRSLGIARLVPADADPAVVATVLHDAAFPTAGSGPPLRTFGDPLTSVPVLQPEESMPVAPPTRHGSVLAVWGATGGPGRTTVATGLADEIARLGAATLLVDADVYGGTVAMAMGVLDESPGLAAACRLAASGRLDAAGLAELCWQVRPGLRVLTGIPLAQRWPEVRASAMPSVLAAARALADQTVVDCGFCLETDEELSFDSMAPRRNGATLAVLDEADLLVLVGSCDPVGVQRVVRGLTDLRDAEVTTPVRVVLNKVRRGPVPGEPALELSAALERFSGVTPTALLPFDPDTVDTAMAAGRLLGEVRSSSPLRTALVELARALTGIESRSERRRRGS